MKMEEDYAVEAAMGMRFRLQLRQDNMATGKAEQRMPFTSPEISFLFFYRSFSLVPTLVFISFSASFY